MRTAVYSIGANLYLVFSNLAQHALVDGDVALYWLFSDFCDIIDAHMTPTKREPQSMKETIVTK